MLIDGKKSYKNSKPLKNSVKSGAVFGNSKITIYQYLFLMDDSVETPIKYFNRISNFHSIIGL
jgi:hypothetical protein